MQIAAAQWDMEQKRALESEVRNAGSSAARPGTGTGAGTAAQGQRHVPAAGSAAQRRREREWKAGCLRQTDNRMR